MNILGPHSVLLSMHVCPLVDNEFLVSDIGPFMLGLIILRTSLVNNSLLASEPGVPELSKLIISSFKLAGRF